MGGCFVSFTLTDLFADLDGCAESLSLDYLTHRIRKLEMSLDDVRGYLRFGARLPAKSDSSGACYKDPGPLLALRPAQPDSRPPRLDLRRPGLERLGDRDALRADERRLDLRDRIEGNWPRLDSAGRRTATSTRFRTSVPQGEDLVAPCIFI